MADEFSRLALVVDSASVDKATSALNVFTQSAELAGNFLRSLSLPFGLAGTALTSASVGATTALTKAQTPQATTEEETGWVAGGRKAAEELGKKAADTATAFHDMVIALNTGLSDALSTAALKGKFSLESFASAVLTQVAKIEASRLAAQLISIGLNWILPSKSDLPEIPLDKIDTTVTPPTGGFDVGTYQFTPSAASSFAPAAASADSFMPAAFSAPTVAAANAAQVAVTVNVGGNGGATGDVSSHDANAFGRDLGQQMQTVAEQVVARNLQPGGKLWRSNYA